MSTPSALKSCTLDFYTPSRARVIDFGGKRLVKLSSLKSKVSSCRGCPTFWLRAFPSDFLSTLQRAQRNSSIAIQLALQKLPFFENCWLLLTKKVISCAFEIDWINSTVEGNGKFPFKTFLSAFVRLECINWNGMLSIFVE